MGKSKFTVTKLGRRCESQEFSDKGQDSEHEPEPVLKEKPSKCICCLTILSSKAKLMAHMELQHPYFSPDFVTCKICAYICENQDTYKEHEELHLAKDAQNLPFCCVLCSSQFTSMTYLNNHVLNEHNDRGRISCEFCNKVE